ncbi:helix-turn-helix domain-containing protein [Brucellaceae bacterium C25G]
MKQAVKLWTIMMPAIPLPFVVALLLIVLLIRIFIENKATIKPVTVFITTCIILMVVVGLRWTFDVAWVRFLQPVIAALLPPVAWLCFAELRHNSLKQAWLHFFFPAFILLLSAFWSQWNPPVDLMLAFQYFGYGLALIRSIYSDINNFECVRLTDIDNTRKAIFSVGALLLFSGIIDLIIAGDFGFYSGKHAALIVAIANSLTLPIIAYAIAAIGKSVPDNDLYETETLLPEAINPSFSDDKINIAVTEQDYSILKIVDAAMNSKKLYLDPDLTLSRLSRRIGIPARQVSSAVNRIHGCNMSQFVNQYRIEKAQDLLKNTKIPITELMFECGFQTKSNFNREFIRVTGKTPSDFRRLALSVSIMA